MTKNKKEAVSKVESASFFVCIVLSSDITYNELSSLLRKTVFPIITYFKFFFKEVCKK